MEENRDSKNSVFGMTDVVRQLQADQVRAQMGTNLPVNAIPLPSRGKVYPETSKLHLLEAVDLKAMTTQEENILTSQALIKKGTVITALIQSCVLDRDINVSEMLSGDRNTLMVAIRSEGYGNDYEVETKCRGCSQTAKQEFDLNAFPLKFLDIEPVRPGANEFPFTLPLSGAKVTFRFLTGKDEEDILAIQESRRKGAKANVAVVDDSLSLQLQYSIVSVNGQTGKNEISTFVRSMRAKDSKALRKYISANQPGIDLTCPITCPHCGRVEEGVTMPIDTTFFWPET